MKSVYFLLVLCLVAAGFATPCAAHSPLTIAWFELRPGIIKTGETAEVTACVYSAKGEPISGVDATLQVPDGLVLKSPARVDMSNLGSKEIKRATWTIAGAKPGEYVVKLRTLSGGDTEANVERRFTVVDKRDPRREFQAVDEAWLTYPARPTLQSGNTAKLSDFKTQPSSKLKNNLFGMTAHIPRSTNEEDPFQVAHAIDGDPATCWGSRWWRTEVPFTPEWLQVGLSKASPVAEVRILPAWRDSGALCGFSISVSPDGLKWEKVADETDYHLAKQPDGSPLRVGDLSWQVFKFDERPVKSIRVEASRLANNNTFDICSPIDPYQLRIAEVVALDKSGKTIPAVAAKASSVNNAWYNTPETIRKTWPRLLQSGVKLNRIGQWGDKTLWAVVEKTKGVYTIDRDLDRSVSECVNGGVDILMTLNYGNNLYQKQKSSPPNLGAPGWVLCDPFLQCSPTTPEAVRAFANYCAFMAKHFRGRVKFYEIWNEENGWFFDDWNNRVDVSMVHAYGRALTAAAKAIKSVDPEARVVFGGIAYSSPDFARIALDEGAGPYIDAVAFHPYGRPTPEAGSKVFSKVDTIMHFGGRRPASIAHYEAEILAYKKLLGKYGHSIEIWTDELNWFAPGQPPMASLDDRSELTQGKYLARFFALNSWLGCRAAWWSLYNANGVQEWALLRSSDMSPRAAYYTATYVSTLLDDSSGTPYARAEAAGDAPKDLVIKTYRNGKGETLIGLWRASVGDDSCLPQPVTLHVPGISVKSAALVDTLYGYRQRALFRTQGADTTVPGLLVGDWPLFVRLK